MIDLTWRSMTLLITGNIDMGLYPESDVLSVPLGTGAILPIFHSLGILPLDIDILNKAVRVSVILSAVDFSIFPEIPSHPVDLEVSRATSKSNMVSSVQSRC